MSELAMSELASAPARFLTAVAHALSTAALYADDHPARARAVELVHQRLRDLQRETPEPSFSFLDGDIIHGQLPLYELTDWPWGRRLAAAGVQRFEFTGPVARETCTALLEQLAGRLAASAGAPEQLLQPLPGVRLGGIGVQGDGGGVGHGDAGGAEHTEPPGDAAPYALNEEAGVVRWLHSEAMEGAPLRSPEAEAVVRSLSVAMRAESLLVVPLLRLRAADEYMASHALNVSVLTMALATYLGLPDQDVHAFGTAALLHDIGMARVPREILAKRGLLTDAERAIIQRHPGEGARMILASERELQVAAAVAYEHHLRPDGTGYPTLRYQREVHLASHLVRVCAAYDAARTDRPHRIAFSRAHALRYIERHAGAEFDANIAVAFSAMLHHLGDRVQE